MFPELFRDDVFRLETKRLWLRWPTARDESAIEKFAGDAAIARQAAGVPHSYPKGAAASFIYGARVGNAQGATLTFALAPVARPLDLIGIISIGENDGAAALGCWLAPPFWGRGLMSEATGTLLKAVFLLTTVPAVTAHVRVDNPAAQRVLEKCGFRHVDEDVPGPHPQDEPAGTLLMERRRSDWLGERPSFHAVVRGS